jgi:hypothetical protein
MFISLSKEDLQKMLKSMDNTGLTTVRINTSRKVLSMVSRPTSDMGFVYCQLEKVDTIYGKDLLSLDR